MENNDIIEVLRHSKFFHNLADESIGSIVQLCREKAFKPGESVFKQGDYCEHLFIIVEGQIHLERFMDMGARQGRVLIDTLGKGRTLGCWRTVLGEPHVLMSSAVCQKPTTLLIINGGDLRRLMTENIHFGYDIMERLCFLLSDRLQAAYGALDRL